jgi:hypothetical protein
MPKKNLHLKLLNINFVKHIWKHFQPKLFQRLLKCQSGWQPQQQEATDLPQTSTAWLQLQAWTFSSLERDLDEWHLIMQGKSLVVQNCSPVDMHIPRGTKMGLLENIHNEMIQPMDDKKIIEQLEKEDVSTKQVKLLSPAKQK